MTVLLVKFIFFATPAVSVLGAGERKYGYHTPSSFALSLSAAAAACLPLTLDFHSNTYYYHDTIACLLLTVRNASEALTRVCNRVRSSIAVACCLFAHHQTHTQTHIIFLRIELYNVISFSVSIGWCTRTSKCTVMSMRERLTREN